MIRLTRLCSLRGGGELPPEIEFVLNFGTQFIFMLLYFAERRAHDDTRNRLISVLMLLGGLPTRDELRKGDAAGGTG